MRCGRLGRRLEGFFLKTLRWVWDPSLPKLVTPALKRTTLRDFVVEDKDDVI